MVFSLCTDCGLKPDMFVGPRHSYCGPLQLWRQAEHNMATQSDTPGKAGGLMSGAASKAVGP
jgi:hypothetical protein